MAVEEDVYGCLRQLTIVFAREWGHSKYWNAGGGGSVLGMLLLAMLKKPVGAKSGERVSPEKQLYKVRKHRVKYWPRPHIYKPYT